MKMSREARRFSKTGLYHIVFRGVNHCHLFEETVDYEKFLSILKTVKEELSFEIYAYCLMSNHVHVFIHEKKIGDITKIMKKILTHYAGWFNRKYRRSGALIANRYKSDCVEDEKYIFSLVRYIHQNPIMANIVDNLEEYKWSSFNDYKKGESEFVDIKFILETISLNKEFAIKDFVELHNFFDTEIFFPRDGKRKSEEEVRKEIVDFLNGKEPQIILTLTRTERNDILMGLRGIGLSIRQIERATGISRGVIQKSCQNRTVPK